MASAIDLHDEALAFHQRLPQRLWKYLNGRGIPDAMIHKHLLGWNGQRITIPISDRMGKFTFFKLAKDPRDKTESPKMLSTRGAHAELYGWEQAAAKPDQIIICEGEFDRLVLEGQGFAAVTSTGGVMAFRPEWAEAIKEIRDIFICFDNDTAGRLGTERVARLLPQARVVRLPEEVGEGGDVTDFFVCLGKSREEFMRLLKAAQTMPLKEPVSPPDLEGNLIPTTPDEEVALLKSLVAIEDLVGQCVALRRQGKNFIGHCPFHDDQHPSFLVYPATRSFYCFACRASGDAISFLMKAEHLTFPEALKVLREFAR
ncbi:MAG: toprim domain-containing protein [Acidobacteria bacterium]|nr:MAG: toprim domain-containing protein [Acidobacteriota bacterium]